MAQFSDLPEEVVESSILPHLNWNDLLRFRRVCKYLKSITEDYIRVNPELTPEIEISEDNKCRSLEAFIDLGIPFTKLFINNPSGHNFFDKLDSATLTTFMESYGSVIKSLRMKQLSLCPCSNEWSFLASLTTLKTLEASYFGYGVVTGTTDHRRALGYHLFRAQKITHLHGPYFPETLNNSLERIRIGNMDSTGYKIGNIHDRITGVLTNCQKLDYISFPVSLLNTYTSPGREFRQEDSVLILMMTQFFQHLRRCQQSGKNHVKQIDFENYYDHWKFRSHCAHNMASSAFLALCKKSVEMGVKLLNVHSTWLEQRQQFNDDDWTSVHRGDPIVSLVYLDPALLTVNLPNLEKIHIPHTSPSCFSTACRFRRPQWPSLKKINVNVDVGSEYAPEQGEVKGLFSLFFGNVVRQNLTEINLSFETKMSALTPKTEDMARSCPNLRVLKISNWPGTNKAISKLWSGLPKLEDLTLENCSGLGNVAFVGEDVENPVFLKLTNLKRLTLKGLDQMPKITDTLFSLVLARMKLTHLTLTSGNPLIKITKTGIAALSKGNEFAESIEKFPFYGWSLANVTSDEFREIGMQFRSYRMM